METFNLSPFYIGQKVVQLVDGSLTMSKKGDVFTILGIEQMSCGCWVVNVGWVSNFIYTRCNFHLSSRILTNGTHWVSAVFYAPIEENFQSISLSEIAKEESKLISVN